jgi:ABC-type branched-subunit amino acid transport system ATPase component/ABC-type branched-subunit amino acid transport system permease subunit
MTARTLSASGATAAHPIGGRRLFGSVLPFLLVFALAALLPLTGSSFWGVIGTRAAIYWILVSGLNLVAGFGGQIAIGYVALLTIGAYTVSVLTAGTVTPAFPVWLAFIAAGGLGAIFGAIIGLPSLRLKSFYFAMTTLGFATIVTQIAVAWQDVTGGGFGIAGPELPAPFNGTWGFYSLAVGAAAVCTWLTANVAHSRFGRGLVAIRDADVAAEACGISKSGLFMMVFLFSGALAGVSGGLFASLQSYISPDAFTTDLSVLFFIAILVGGRGSILGPLLGTIVLTILPQLAAPLVAWSSFLYAGLLLLMVLVMPGGIAELLDFKNRRPLESGRSMRLRADIVSELVTHPVDQASLALKDVSLQFGAVRAIDGLDLEVLPGQVHGLIGPNGSGKTTTLNAISGYYRPSSGSITLCGTDLVGEPVRLRASSGIARTFQTPRNIGAASVLDNVMIGGTIDGRGTFVETLLYLGRHRRDEAMLRARAMLALRVVGLERLKDIRADRLQHSELRFVEIARALMSSPRFLLLDEPAAGLSVDEIRQLGELVRAISRQGIGVLLVEHHTDLIFSVCDRVTVLNLGRELAAGTPEEIRQNRSVVSAYLGG